jgi:uncharacterized surface protein with fasciclin (FAS1) repeats|uniref:FAS1 domain-containing protein n=1 Tax=Fagus sylvatica TaxID=28930 RepID=A0A2N9HPQ9_FAGSY
MTKQALFSLSLVLVFLFHCTTALGQHAHAPTLPAASPAPPADVPAPPGPPDVTKILQKVGGFAILVRLLKSTGVADQLKGQLNDSNIRFTLFAPNDNAFSNLKAGTLNSLNNDKKVRLIQFHILPTYYTLANFQTVSNPLRTQAGDNKPGDYPLNVTSTGSQANISTGLVNATVTGTLFSNFQLAIYQVDKVLLPLDLFVSKPPSPAPALAPALAPTKSKPKPKTTTAANSPKSSSSSTTPTLVDSGAVLSLAKHGILVSMGIAVFVAAFSL